MTGGRARDPGAGAFAAVDHLLADAVVDGVAPGFVGVIADRDGVLHESCQGVTALGGDRPMTRDTIFWLASMTKLVTTVATMQLVEAGELDLDAPVAALLPELAAPRVVTGIGADGIATTRPAHGAITLRRLLTHTSGIGYELMNPLLLAARGSGGPPPSTSLASLEGPLATDPGDGWTYGYGVDWAGIAVERRSGMTLDRYLERHVLAPLGMRNTGFAVGARTSDRVAATHLRDAEGRVAIIPSPASEPDAWEFRSGGAGLLGTAHGYGRLLRMLLGRGELDGIRILRPETVDAMGDDQIGDAAAGRIDTAHPALVLPYDPLPGQDGGWSLLGSLNRAPLETGRRAGAASWAGIAGTVFWLDREADLCGVLLAQIMPFADPALLRVQRAFESAAYAGAAALRGRKASKAA